MKEILKKIILYVLAFIALWACSILVLWTVGLFLATDRSGIIWDGFKTGALAFAILYIMNRFSNRKKQ